MWGRGSASPLGAAASWNGDQRGFPESRHCSKHDFNTGVWLRCSLGKVTTRTSVGVAGRINPLAASLAQAMAVMSLKRGTAPSCPPPGTPHGRSTGLGMAALVPCPQPQSTLTWGEGNYIHRACMGISTPPIFMAQSKLSPASPVPLTAT